jgi:Flp pilus assembly protein TadD
MIRQTSKIGSLALCAMAEALTLLERGQSRQAERLCSELLRNGEDIGSLLLLGLAIGAQGEAERAAPILNRVAAARREFAHPCSDVARLLTAQGGVALVERQFRACLDLTPDDLRLCYGLAAILRDRGEGDAAVQLLAPVVDANPDSAEAHDEMGLALAEAGRFAEAASLFRSAVALDPAQAVFQAHLGMMLKVEGRFEEALEAYDRAVALAPDDRQIRVNRAVARLHAGRFAEAWQDEAWVLAGPASNLLLPERRLLPLSRQPRLEGCTVLVVQEEGLGDTLQFMRYLPLLAERGARVVAAVPPALTRLLRSFPGIAAVPDGDATVPAHDFHTSFNSLPRVFSTTLETIPGRVPYLAADPDLAKHWARRLPAGGMLRVGLCWAGQARPWLTGFVGLDSRRSATLATLAPLGMVPGVRLISLQKGPAADQVRSAGFDLLDLTDHLVDFADTAALVANLDLVISVDTSVVHLAGAMGKSAFLLDRYDNCWRWLSGRDDSPWYPSLRIFRQRQSGDWPPVIARVATALAAMAGHPSRAPLCQGAA